MRFKINSMKKIFPIAILIVLIIYSCSTNNPTPTPQSCALNSSNIIGAYKKTSVTYRPTPISGIQDIYSTWSSCKKNIIYYFSPNQYTFNTNPIQVFNVLTLVDTANCSDIYSNNYMGEFWRLENNGINHWNATANELGRDSIIEFNCSYFKTKYTNSFDSAVTITTYTRQ